MNILLFHTPEFCAAANSAEIRLHDSRMRYVLERHDIKEVGITVKAGVIETNLGRATLLARSPQELVFRYEVDPAFRIPDRSNITIIVGVPRPQTVKKIIQIAVSFGIQAVHFVPFEKTVKSYLSSKVWKTDALNSELFEALEQAGDVYGPLITLHQRSEDFFSAHPEFITNNNAKKIIFDGRDTATFQQRKAAIRNDESMPPIILVFGPEAGFTEFERSYFQKKNFSMISLNERMLRLEHAICAAISLVELGLNHLS